MDAKISQCMIYLNGQIISADSAGIIPSDRGLLLGDGLFETMRADRGRIGNLQRHWQRLKKSADYLEIPLPLTLDQLADIIQELLHLNHYLDSEASLRLTLTRGAGPRGLLPPAAPTPTIILTAAPWTAPASSVSVKIVEIRRNELSPLANIKSLNYLDNILARQAAVKAGAQEAILLNSRGHVAEASAANIFIVTLKGQILTPRLQDGALPGITREVVLHLLKQLNLEGWEQPITVEDLYQAKEIFLTNSLIAIQPVSQIDQQALSYSQPQSITARLQAAYKDF